jgi:hypothetical protein
MLILVIEAVFHLQRPGFQKRQPRSEGPAASVVVSENPSFAYNRNRQNAPYRMVCDRLPRMADAVVQAVATEENLVQPWSLSSRTLLRFVCCYWLLYALSESGRLDILDNIPGAQFLAQPYIRMWHVVVPPPTKS